LELDQLRDKSVGTPGCIAPEWCDESYRPWEADDCDWEEVGKADVFSLGKAVHSKYIARLTVERPEGMVWKALSTLQRTMVYENPATGPVLVKC
jgi:hypothetical protein